MRPKGKLLALVAMFAAIGLITATGAFTTVEAERTATVDVTGDASALLALSESDNIGDVGAVTGADDGEMAIDLSESALSHNDGSASGLNPNATTTITPMFNVTNQGSETVTLNVTIDTDDASGIESMTLVYADGTELSEDDTLAPGDVVEYGLKIETGDIDGDESFDISIIFEATADNS